MSKRVDNVEADEVERPLEYELTDPPEIPVFKEKVRVIKMRNPTGADLIAIGNPVRFMPYVDPPTVEHDMKLMSRMIARLSEIPSTSIERIGPRDLMAIAWLLSPFFIPKVV